MSILSYHDFLKVQRRNASFFNEAFNRSTANWGEIRYSSLHEGLGVNNERITVDFSQDSPEDSVRLNPPVSLRSVKKASVPVYRGYAMEKNDNRGDFMKAIKKDGAISQADLEKLIDLTYPKDLADRSVKILFTTGSSDPLAANVAEAIRSLYYPNAIVVDIIKRYYGADVQDIVDREAYDKADDRTKKMIDTYLRRSAPEFSGFIKKSSGLQSGARRLLKPGHQIDDYVINKMREAEEEWREKYLKDKSMNPTIALRYKPAYLFVDDIIIEGSTLRGIFNQMIKTVSAGETDLSVRNIVKGSIFGYCLLSYKDVSVD